MIIIIIIITLSNQIKLLFSNKNFNVCLPFRRWRSECKAGFRRAMHNAFRDWPVYSDVPPALKITTKRGPIVFPTLYTNRW